MEILRQRGFIILVYDATVAVITLVVIHWCGHLKRIEPSTNESCRVLKSHRSIALFSLHPLTHFHTHDCLSYVYAAVSHNWLVSTALMIARANCKTIHCLLQLLSSNRIRRATTVGQVKAGDVMSFESLSNDICYDVASTSRRLLQLVAWLAVRNNVSQNTNTRSSRLLKSVAGPFIVVSLPLRSSSVLSQHYWTTTRRHEWVWVWEYENENEDEDQPWNVQPRFSRMLHVIKTNLNVVPDSPVMLLKKMCERIRLNMYFKFTVCQCPRLLEKKWFFHMWCCSWHQWRLFWWFQLWRYPRLWFYRHRLCMRHCPSWWL